MLSNRLVLHIYHTFEMRGLHELEFAQAAVYLKLGSRRIEEVKEFLPVSTQFRGGGGPIGVRQKQAQNT